MDTITATKLALALIDSSIATTEAIKVEVLAIPQTQIVIESVEDTKALLDSELTKATKALEDKAKATMGPEQYTKFKNYFN